MARPLAPLTLTEEERETLLRWARRPKTAQALACRARIVLACAAGRSNGEVAEALHLTRQTIGKWRIVNRHLILTPFGHRKMTPTCS